MIITPERFNEMYSDLLRGYTDWCELHLNGDKKRNKPADERNKQAFEDSIEMSISKLKTLSAKKLNKLVQEQCVKEFYVGKSWEDKHYIRSVGDDKEYYDILAIALVHHLTGFLPEITERDKTLLEEQANLVVHNWSLFNRKNYYSFVKLYYFKQLFNIKPNNKLSSKLYERYCSNVDFFGNFASIEAIAMTYEITGKKPEELAYVYEDKPLIHVDEERAFKLVDDQFDEESSLNEFSRRMEDEFYLKLGDKLALKYDFIKNKVRREPIKLLKYETSPRDYNKLVENIRKHLVEQIGNKITYREQMWNEICAVYENGFLTRGIFCPVENSRDRIANRYYHGKIYYGGYGNSDDDNAYFKKEDFNYETYLFDILVLNKIMGPPKEKVLRGFIRDRDCWPKLRRSIKETFGEK